MIRITIFASGSGTNAENIIKYFQDNNRVEVIHVLTNNKNAKVIERSNKLNINCIRFNKIDFYETDVILNHLIESTDYIILAGFLWIVPEKIVNEFSNKIINIHPALLPKYGGKGMYGMHIHKAIIENKEPKTGITIHFVNKNYDEGAIIFQKSVRLDANDGVNDVAKKIHELEMTYFPKIIKNVILHRGIRNK
jgi:phosphoribosylglycinamide formyltransferase-1